MKGKQLSGIVAKDGLFVRDVRTRWFSNGKKRGGNQSPARS